MLCNPAMQLGYELLIWQPRMLLAGKASTSSLQEGASKHTSAGHDAEYFLRYGHEYKSSADLIFGYAVRCSIFSECYVHINTFIHALYEFLCDDYHMA